jgi:hypothetical protein
VDCEAYILILGRKFHDFYWFIYSLLLVIIYFSLILRQMIRLITFTIGGHAYLNFMGNEFGHPKVRLLSLYYSYRLYFMWLMIFSCSSGLSSQCKATISHLNLLTVGGIFWQVECIVIYFLSTRCQSNDLYCKFLILVSWHAYIITFRVQFLWEVTWIL